MSNKLKALAVAAVLSVSASANAAIDTFNGDSEFYFNAWDITTGKGYTFDLDWSESFESIFGADAAVGSGNATILSQASNVSNSIIYDGSLTGFASQFSDTSNVVWTLGAYDGFGRNRFVTTVSATTGASQDLGSNQVKGAVTVMTGQNVQSNGFVASGNVGDLVADEYALTVVADGLPYAGTPGNDMGGNYTNGDVTNGMGDTAELYFYAASANSPFQPGFNTALTTQVFLGGEAVNVSTYEQNGEWRLSIAAVPEPQTYAMLLAGLGVMGASARRRMK